MSLHKPGRVIVALSVWTKRSGPGCGAGQASAYPWRATARRLPGRPSRSAVSIYAGSGKRQSFDARESMRYRRVAEPRRRGRRSSARPAKERPASQPAHCPFRTSAARPSRWSARPFTNAWNWRSLPDAGSRELTLAATRMASGLEVGLLLSREAEEPAGGSGEPPRPPASIPIRSELQPGADVHHRRTPGVDRADDLLGVDPLEVNAGRGDIRVLDMRVIWQLGLQPRR
jgi:hypothetical protein